MFLHERPFFHLRFADSGAVQRLCVELGGDYGIRVPLPAPLLEMAGVHWGVTY